MARSQESFGKKEKEKKRLKKQKEKMQKREERKNAQSDSTLENMMAYVDEYGNLSDTPPDPNKKKEKIDASTIEIGVPKREEQDTDAVYKGRVEFFNDTKGFGFIKDQTTQEKYFVHVTGVLEPIAEGDTVLFELEQGMRGLNAVRVKRA